MEYTFSERMIKPYLYACDNIITEVNKEFMELTGFKSEELLGKSLLDIGYMLKINSQMLLINMNIKHSGFIFTKSLEAREVDILISQGKETTRKKYTFTERSNSRLQDKLIFVEQLFIVVMVH